MSSSYSLDKVLNLPKWQNIQESLSHLSHLAILTVDYKGHAATKHSNCSNFCSYVRNVPSLAKQCQKCDARGGLEAIRQNKPYIYRCHFDIIDIAIPLSFNNKYIGAILAGQVRLLYPERGEHLEHIVSSSKSYLDSLEPSSKLMEYYQSLPKFDCEHIYMTAKTLYHLSSYILDEISGIEHTSIEEMNKFNPEEIPVKERTAKVLLNKYINTDSEEFMPLPDNSVIIPALSYIYENKHDFLTLSDAAILCHVSSSYFSRLFFKELGQNYSSFMTRTKIEWAKQLLKNTDWSISKISQELGFADPTYFNKLFKKQQNITPGNYRKYI